MTNDSKPDLFFVSTKPISTIPKESYEEFKNWVLNDGLTPSSALRQLMNKYNCQKLDVSIPIHLIELTYPSMDITRQGFRFKIIDSAYPNSDPKQFSDKDFDEGIKEILSLPPIEY